MRVRTADFRAWDRGRKDLHSDVRIFGPDVTGRPDGGLDEPGRIARNLEPEYIVADERRAYVTLQETNAIAVLDIRTAKFVDIWPFGYKGSPATRQRARRVQSGQRDPDRELAGLRRLPAGRDGLVPVAWQDPPAHRQRG
jgi:hypothetical protein